jgi:hypothetical protein
MNQTMNSPRIRLVTIGLAALLACPPAILAQDAA